MPTVAYRAVRSRRIYVNAPKMRKYLEAGINREVKPHFIHQFDKVVANWKHRVEFRARMFLTTDAIKLNVFAAGPNRKIWGFVTKGTRPHIIRAKRGKSLAFMWGGPGSYTPKTSPPANYGGPGTVKGGKMHFPQQVKHPGTKPRPFPAEIRKREKAWYNRTMENMWRRGLRAMQKGK